MSLSSYGDLFLNKFETEVCVKVVKEFVNEKLLTTYEVTGIGLEFVKRYLDELEIFATMVELWVIGLVTAKVFSLRLYQLLLRLLSLIPQQFQLSQSKIQSYPHKV
jgi:hypothetical protein